jgi:aerobic C4-dicarboxylate transport protein
MQPFGDGFIKLIKMTILGIDRFMSEARSLTNLVGNDVATLVVARWCGELDDRRLRNALDAATAGGAIPTAQVVTDADAS